MPIDCRDRSRPWAFFRSVALLMAVATPVLNGPATLAQAHDPVVWSPTEIAVHLRAQGQTIALQTGKKLRPAIAKAQAVFATATGDSRVLMVELPTVRGPYTLAVKSVCNCDGPAKSVFVPTVILLDAALVAVRTVDEDGFILKGYSFEASVELDGSTGPERYLLIRTNGGKIGMQIGTLRTFDGILTRVTFPYFRAGHGSFEFNLTPRKLK